MLKNVNNSFKVPNIQAVWKSLMNMRGKIEKIGKCKYSNLRKWWNLRGVEDEKEQRERKLSSRRANFWRVWVHETEMLVEEGRVSIMSIIALHLCLANSTVFGSAIVGVYW